nr:PREDICTED: pecanex-like protein 4 [Lepisosteus oculatus]XP_015205652.1 PREDICTED: pecanex-like protein 4 [Lepisosteus oculatus]XP_015205653.1 PREDICTED: pecanex-like protein 4 [Lepisosteus oculatus]XP_015205654.1 PREDICTED: pecanex-like protein 4 [Lepisosteus oculatus]XP_015205655.1 PREDICTED: pecanex-like protein 4 [Lepisosteus oculatus]
MGPDVPLLNEYKQEFFWKRFPQTVLGGPRFKLGYCAPPYIYVNQIILFLAPWVFGGVGTLLYQLQLLEDYYAAALAGGLMLGATLVAHILTLWAVRRTGTVEWLQSPNILADEEEYEFPSCASAETIKFIIPGKKSVLNTVFHAVLAGVLCGLGTWYVLLNRLTSLYNSTWAAVLIFVLSWVTLCIGEYSLVINTATETATFQAQDTYEITPLTRPLYMFAFIAVDLAQRFLGAVPELQQVNQVLHVLFLFLPLLWALGMLSPVDALFLWGMEQTLVFGLGGSPMSTNLRLLVMFVASVSVAVGTFFIPSALGVVLFTTAMGFLLSSDLSQARDLLRPCKGAVRPQDKRSDPPHTLGWRLGWREVLLHSCLLLAAVTEAGLLHHFITPAQHSGTGPQATISYILFALLFLTWALREVQGAYLLWGVFHNPLYPKQMGNVRVFKQELSGLRKAGAVRRVLLNLVSPFVMIAFLSMDGSLQRLHTASLCVGFTRAFRAVWQSTEDSLLQMVVITIVRLADKDNKLVWWDSLGTGIQLLLVGLVLDRLGQFVSKLRFALTVLVTSWTEKKQRRQSAATLLALNGVLCPVLLAVLGLSAVLSAPLLPLFTLPVFFVGFPRPLRSWPSPVGSAACSCPDSVYYQQMVWSLASAFRTAFAVGSLGSPSPGSHFLGRFQDRVLWIMVLERGFSYCSLNIKGLELQETSCHTAEARRVDEVFENAFEPLEGPGRSLVNMHFSNILTPCATLPVHLYSDARNVLTGIIDSHGNLRQLKDDFLKVLVWVLLQHCSRKCKSFGRKGVDESTSIKLAPVGGEPFAEVNVATIKSSSSKLRRDSSSLNSDTFGDWSDEDDLFGPQPSRKTIAVNSAAQQMEVAPSLPGSVEMQSLFGNSASLGPDHGARVPQVLGLPAVDRGRKAMGLSHLGTLSRVIFSSPHSEQLSLPEEWRAGPLPLHRMQQLKKMFPADWYQFVLSRLELAAEGQRAEEVVDALRRDEVLQDLYAHVVMSCYGVTVGAESTIISPSYAYRVYCGDVPWTPGLDWLTTNKELFQLVLKAFRYSFKLLFDQASLGPPEGAGELLSLLEEYERDWYIGLVSERGWQDAVLQEKPFLFSLGHDLTMGTYTGRVLTLQELLVQIGRLNAEGVRGQWANLSWELLYATNDDEERYSIQAHPVLLRNLTVQAADPPLGYPIYSSPPLHVPCF